MSCLCRIFSFCADTHTQYETRKFSPSCDARLLAIREKGGSMWNAIYARNAGVSLCLRLCLCVCVSPRGCVSANAPRHPWEFQQRVARRHLTLWPALRSPFVVVRRPPPLPPLPPPPHTRQYFEYFLGANLFIVNCISLSAAAPRRTAPAVLPPLGSRWSVGNGTMVRNVRLCLWLLTSHLLACAFRERFARFAVAATFHQIPTASTRRSVRQPKSLPSSGGRASPSTALLSSCACAGVQT